MEIALFGLIVAGLAVAACVAVVGLFLKLVFKVLLVPVWLALAIVKGVLFLVLLGIALIFAPILLLIVVLSIPFLLIAGFLGFGWALVA